MKDVARTTCWARKTLAASRQWHPAKATTIADRSRFALMRLAPCSRLHLPLCSGLRPRRPSSGEDAGRYTEYTSSRDAGRYICVESDESSVSRQPRPMLRGGFTNVRQANLSRRQADHRRLGTALILVVAVLGILFVAGAALLNQVTFSTSTLEAARQARQTDAAIDAIEDMALGWLANGFIGPDGMALNPESRFIAHVKGDPNTPCTAAGEDCVLAMPPVVETPGVVPWIDQIEPVSEDPVTSPSILRFKNASNLSRALETKSGVDPAIDSAIALTGRAIVDLSNPITRYDADYDGNNVALELPRDSDGDGIVDSFQFRLPDGVLPAEIQRELADRLRDPNYNASDPDRDPDELWLSLRIIPHGGMMDLNQARDSMVNFLFDPGNTSFMRPGFRYPPQANEWYLRHRGLMLPRSLPQSPLLSSNLTEGYGQYMLPPHEQPFGGGASIATLAATPSNREWWGYDFMTDANGQGSPWTDMIYDPNAAKYDFVHLVTTISYDDMLRRPGRFKLTGEDWITAMRNADSQSSLNPFFFDNYPPKLDTGMTGAAIDPRLGRLKVSLPELDEILKGQALLLRDLSTNQAAKDQIVGIIQEAFLLMLMEHGQLPDRERAVTAAMLTANLIDFADADPAGEPTRVEVIDIDTTGAIGQFPLKTPVTGADDSTPLAVYGFERQPFITEVYASFVPSANVLGNDASAAASSFAIELYNPYPFALPLTNYRLREIRGPQLTFDVPIAGSPPDFLDEDLSGETIPAQGYLTVISLVDPGAAGQTVDSSDDWAVDEESIIGLFRQITNGPEILVDVFDVTNDVNSGSPTALPDPMGNNVRSWERDNSEWAVNDSRWRFVVPRAGEVASNNAAQHTLGAINSFTDPTIFAVHVDVANHIKFQQAFPTTGSLLLTSRMAHVYDGSTTTTPNWTAPFNRVNTPASLLLTRTIATDYVSRENGRIPVFDLAVDSTISPPLPAARNFSLYATPGGVEGISALPWGQLIFDYFTALPLEQCDPTNFTCDPTKLWPRVDQEGLRVHGRININAAPKVVLGSAPMVPASKLPTAFQKDVGSVYAGNTSFPKLGDIGNGDLAEAMVWYREAIKVDNPRDYETERDPYNTLPPTNGDLYVPRQGYGYLTAGELFNVKLGISGLQDTFRMDAGALDQTADQQQGVYDRAVGRMVALGDWFTTRSHVFTVYGVVRGQFNDDQSDMVELEKSLRATDQRAIRFQTTVDRLPMFFGRSQPERIGARVVGGYADVRGE